MNKKIALYTFFDDNFFEYGFTMLYSFLTNNPWFNGDIFILSDNGENCCLSEEKFAILKGLYGNIFMYKVDIGNYTKVFENFRGTIVNRREFFASFYKIEIFKKDDYDVKFFIDADTCFTGNVEELFGERIEGTLALMSRDILTPQNQANDFSFKTNDDYANMGFLVINGRLLPPNEYSYLLNECASIKSGDYVNSHTARGTWGDQDCLNELIKDVMMVPSKIYNACVTEINFSNIKDTKIFHYYGAGRKPWDFGNCFYDGFLPWYRYYFWAMKKMKEIRGKK